MAISLKKAYRACLWLAEQKIGVNAEDRRGEYDLDKPEGKRDDFKWERSELVAALPPEYFEYKCYFYPFPTASMPHAQINDDGSDLYLEFEKNVEGNVEIDIKNITLNKTKDGIKSNTDNCIDYGGCNFIDASNMVDGDLFAEESDEYFERFSPNGNKIYFGPYEEEMFHRDKPKIIEKILRLSIPLCTVDDEVIPDVENDNKPVLAAAMAHYTLMGLMKTGQVHVSGFIELASQISDITAPLRSTSNEKEIPYEFWLNNPVPNYEISAVEEGIKRRNRILKHNDETQEYSDNALEFDESVVANCEFWYRNITISSNFVSWHMERVRALSSEPDNATFKMVNGKYLIQYSTDKSVEYKAWKGFSMLYKVMRFYKTAEFNPEFGCEPFEIELRSCEDEVEQYENLTTVKKNNESRIRKYIRKQQNLIFWSLENFHNIDEFDDDSVSRKGEVKSIILAKVRSIKDVSIKYNYTGESIMIDEVELYIGMESSRFFDNKNEIKKTFKVDFTDDEKDKEKVRKNIHNALKELGVRSPNLAMHLGSMLDGKKQGVGYNSIGFYYVSNAATEWDFG